MSEVLDPTLLPILLVVVPLVAAAGILAIGRLFGATGIGLSLLATAVQAAMALYLAGRTLLGGDGVRTTIAGFPAEEGGIELFVDGVSALVVLLIAAVGVAVLVASVDERRSDSFYSLYVLLLAGLSGLAVTNDVFNMYVFLEISGLAAYALIASDGTGSSALAALKYLIVGTVGASLYLIGVGYAYVATGYLNMVQLAETLPEVGEFGYADPQVQAAFGLIAAGFAIKIALFPVHTWQPDAYTEAPDRMTALIAALVSTTAAYALARVALDVFTPAFFAANPIVHDLVLAVAAASVIAGSVLAVLQSEVKRMFAYSSVSQFGLVVVGIFLLNDTALVGAIVHLVGHAIVKAGLFLGVAGFAAAYGLRTVDDYAGLARRAPWASAAVAVLALALVGIPPTVGFVGKLFVAIGAVEQDAWVLVAVIVASTVLTLGYVLRLLERMYFTDPAPASGESTAGADVAADGGASTDRQSQSGGSDGRIARPLLAVVIVAALASIGLGLLGAWFDAVLEPAVEVLLE
ncbi:proton-conducting transporter membrane subunit [Halovivax limisalsi]|uniref:proton-conducting transporter transmembrane domain-containing protein n=1 Tax=Halovivax limisalsi TaxID=1453760 RepID=UPI001FFD5086|nr:proton-conducting transporter membrane subunit [Halovivax limisalsi]